MILRTEKLLVASDVMTSNPKSLHSGATLREAMAFLLDNGFSAAPIVNIAGRPLGVVSFSDLVRLQRESIAYLQREVYESANRKLSTGERVGEGFEIEKVPSLIVDAIMTPIVISVDEKCLIQDVIEQMLKNNIHRIFVLDQGDTLVGVITSMDVLRALRTVTL